MTERSIISDAVVGAVAGYVGVQLMTPVTTKIYELTSEEDKEREKEVSPGIAYTIAAGDLGQRLGISLGGEEAEAVGKYFHLGLGFGAGILYMMLRRLGWGPLWSGSIVGLGLWGVVDEGLTPLMDWSAPNSAYSIATHLRGLAGHLTLGAATAVTAEALCTARD